MKGSLRILVIVLPWLGIAGHSFGSPTEPDFYRDVYPFLKTNCISCHNKTTTKAGLNMETPELMRKGGDSGPSIVPGKGGESLIVEASLHTPDLEMPPKNNKTDSVNLSPAEIAILKTWIDQGAKSSVQQERKVQWQPLAPGVHPIYTVAMTGDGHFAACGRSNQIFLYDLATRQFVTQILDPAEKSGGAHRALVNTLAFSPDGTRLASGGFREVKIWRREKNDFAPRKGDPVLKADVSVLSKDGSKIICRDQEGALLVLVAGTGKVAKKIPGVGLLKILSLSPDATMAAGSEENGKLSVWNLVEGKIVALREPADPPTGKVRSLTWTADGKSIATAGEDKILRIWSLPTDGSNTFSDPGDLKGATGTITSIVAGADQLVTAGDDGKIRVWSVSQAKIVKEIARAGVTSLGLSPDGKFLVTGGTDSALRIWDLATGQQTIELRGSVTSSGNIADLEWTISAQTLEQAFQKTVVTGIEAQNKELDVLRKKAEDAIVAMNKALPAAEKAVKPTEEARAGAQKAVDEAAAAAAGKSDTKLDSDLKTAQDKLITAKTDETSAIAAFKAVQSNISDAGAQVARIDATKKENAAELAESTLASEASKAQSTKATSELAAAKTALTAAGSQPLAVEFSDDGQKVAAVFDNGSLNVWAVATGTPVDEAAGGKTTQASLLFLPDGSFVGCGSDGTLFGSPSTFRWKLERVLGGEKGAPYFADRINTVRFSPDGKTLATGGGEPSRSGDVILFAVETGKPTATWKERHDDSVVSLDFSPDGKLLASGAADTIAKVTDIATGKQVNLFEGHTHHVMGVSFRADGRVLATAGADGVVNSWDMILGERKKKIVGWNKEVTSLQYIGATNQIVTSAGDNLIRIINDDGGQIRSIAKLPDFMQSAASTPGGTTIIGGGEDSFLRIWDGTNGKELAAFGSSKP